MPELPEVETVRRGVALVMEGKTLKSADVQRRDLRVPIPDDFEDIVGGQAVLQLLRRGKYIAVQLGNGRGFVWHLGMSGSVRIYKCGEVYVSEKHDHVIFKMDGGEKVVFNDPRRFGMMYLMDIADWEMEKPFCDMGPEPLGNGFNDEVLQERLAGRKISIKGALLDQRVVAGVGNIYACEALYRAGVHPARRACDVDAGESEGLAVAIKDVLHEAIAAGGSSLQDHKMTDGSLGYFQHHFDVYDREGESCSRCGESILCVERIVQSGRSSFYCKNSQN